MRFDSSDPLTLAPDVLTLEITTRCNLACVMCPHGLPNGMSIKRDAPNFLVDQLLEQLDTLSEVHPTGVGEPLLADGFWRIVQALEGRVSPNLIVHTNGMLLTARNVGRLVRAPISRVNVSVDAARPETYANIRGSDMRKTIDGARRLAFALSNMNRNSGNLVRISMVLMKQNIEECTEFVQLAKEIGAKAVYFEHLTEVHDSANSWNVTRGDFEFNYADSMLFGFAEYADAHVLKAMDLADRIGIRIDGPQILISPSNLHHLNRPCRVGALEV